MNTLPLVVTSLNRLSTVLAIILALAVLLSPQPLILTRRLRPGPETPQELCLRAIPKTYVHLSGALSHIHLHDYARTLPVVFVKVNAS